MYITVLPETRRIAEGVKSAFRAVDNDAREAGKRWGREIERGVGDVKVDVKADTAAARAEIASLESREVTVRVKADTTGLPPILGGSGSGSGGGFGGGGGGAFKLNAGLVGIGLFPAAATAVTNLAGAMQQLAGAGAVLPGVFAGLASSIGVAKLGTQGMSDAFDAVTKASDGTKASVEAANKALADLSPNQAEAVKTVAGLKGTFTEVRNIAGDNLFAGFSEGLRSLVTADLPAVTRGVDGISRSLNQNLLQAMTSLSSGSSQSFLERIFGNTAGAQSKLTEAIDPIIHAFGVLAAAGSDSLPRLATAVGNVADRFNKFITDADGDGRLQRWISDGLTGFTNLGNIVLNIGKSFTAITQAAGGGAGLLSTLQNATGAMSTFLNSTEGQTKLRDFFETGRRQLGQLRDIAVQLGPVLGGVFQAGLNAANLWLPVIRQVLTIINSIPGGAQAVVTAFVAWKTIQGPIALVNSLTNVVRLLQVTLPAAASTGAASMSASLAGVASTIAGIAASAAALPATAVGFAAWGNSVLHDAPNSAENARARGAAGLAGDSSQARPTDNFIPGGGLPGASAERRGTRTMYPGGGLPGAQADRRGNVAGAADPLPIPAVSTYTPPVITEVPKGSGTPNLPYSGTADPYAAGAYSPMAPGYISDQALLANVPTGIYTQDQRGDLTKGLADCSSAVEDLVNLMDGRSTAGASVSTLNEGDFLASRGFVRGMGGPGDFRVGYNTEHTQATLPGGTPFNWGSNAAAARGGVGGTGADDKAFTDHWYRPAGGGDPMSSMYGGGPMATGGLTSQDLSLRNAQQRINDTQHSQEQAEGRLNELRAKGTATDRQMEAAEYAVAKAKREHQDAIDGLTVAQDKFNKAQAKGQGGGTGDMSSLGGDLFGGVLQAIGLDGTLFKNPFEGGLWKGISGGLNFGGAMGQAQGGQNTGSLIPGGGGGGGGLGGLLGMATSFMPGMPGGSNSPNLVDAVQNAQPGGPGSPGPGNPQAPGTVFDMRGSNLGVDPRGFNQTVTDLTASQNRYPALTQNLPVG